MKFFAFIKSYKTAVFVVLLFFVSVGIFLPILVSAVRRIYIVVPEVVPMRRESGLLPETHRPLRTFTLNGEDFTNTDVVWLRDKTSFGAPIDEFRDWRSDISTTRFITRNQLTSTFYPGTAIYDSNGFSTKRLVQFLVCREGVVVPPQAAAPYAFFANPAIPDGCSEAGETNYKKLRTISVVDNESFSAIYEQLSQGLAEISNFFSEFWDRFLSATWEDFLIFIIVELTNFFSAVSGLIAQVSSEIFRYVLNEFIADPTNNWAITRGAGIAQVFLVAWGIVKGYANMVIVLSLVAVATMMILRLQVEKAQSWLLPIILTALLINFSVVLVGLFVDATNLLIRQFTVGTEAQAGIVFHINQTWNTIARPIRFPVDLLGAARYAFFSSVINVMYISVAVVFLYFTLMVIQRYFILAILFIISPLAFALGIFPYEKVQKLRGDWWQYFLKYCFVLIPAAFFLRLSTDILMSNALNWEILGPADIGGFTRVLFNFAIVIGFLFFGMKMAFKSAGPIVNTIMAAAAAIGAAIITGGASTMASVSGVSTLYNKSKETVTGALEKTGLITAGTAATMRQERLQKDYAVSAETKKKLDNATPDQIKAIATGSAITSEGMKQKAYAIQKMFEDGTINSLPKGEKEKLAKYAISSGISSSTVTKGQPDLAEMDKGGLAKVKARNPGISDADALKKLKREKYAEMKIENLTDKSDTDIIERAKEKTAEGAKHLQEAIKRNILHLVGSFDETAELLKHSQDIYGTSTVKDAIKSNYHYNKSNEEALAKIRRDNPLFTDDQVKQEAEIDAAKKVNGHTIREDLSTDAIDMMLMEHIRAKTISEADRYGGLSEKKVVKFKDLLPDIQTKINDAHAMGDADLEALWQDKYDAIDDL